MTLVLIGLCVTAGAFGAALHFPIGWQRTRLPNGIPVITLYLAHRASRRMFYFTFSAGCRRGKDAGPS